MAARKRYRYPSQSPKQEPLYDPPTEDVLVRTMVYLNDWYTVGLKLGVPTNELDRIKSMSGDVEQKKREMFRVWLLGIEDPTWGDLLEVLKELNIANASKIVENNYDPKGTRPPPVITMPKLSDKPTMAALQCLTTGSEKLRVVDSVATKWRNMAYQLNFDVSKVDVIEKQNSYRPLESCQEMFKEWLTGSGKQPANWCTLIETLEDIQLHTLAGYLNEALNKK